MPMKSAFRTTSLSAALALATAAAGVATAQVPNGLPSRPAPAPAPNPAPPPPQVNTGADPNAGQLYENGAVLPAPVEVVETAPNFQVPTEPLAPYLLTSENGPFMVMAHIFRGDYAVEKAHALAIELRREHRMPAYVYFLKVAPGGSNIAGIPPTAERDVMAPVLDPEDAARVVDEAAVLVGNFPTIEDADDFHDKVRHIKPKVLANHKSPFFWRDGEGLKRAWITTNPLKPAQDLYPGRPHPHKVAAPPPGAVVDSAVLRSSYVKRADPFVVEMNEKTPHSIYKCPAPYTLVVADFSGRAMLGVSDRDPGLIAKLKQMVETSPLRTAHEDAEKIAEQLAKHPTLRSMGVQPYVYHDRTSSKVTIGAFSTPDDPQVDALRKAAMTIAVEMGRGKDDKGQDLIISRNLAPAAELFEVPRPE